MLVWRYTLEGVNSETPTSSEVVFGSSSGFDAELEDHTRMKKDEQEIELLR